MAAKTMAGSNSFFMTIHVTLPITGSKSGATKERRFLLSALMGVFRFTFGET